jgi:hypothetical protein
MTARLAVVPQSAESQPEPDLSYEYRERQFIASRDWAAVHVAADRRAPISLADGVRRWWR